MSFQHCGSFLYVNTHLFNAMIFKLKAQFLVKGIKEHWRNIYEGLASISSVGLIGM